jgi:DNA-binding cell septation regulator SpoVG
MKKQRISNGLNIFHVSEVQIIPISPKEGLVAFASCVVNNALFLGSIAIYTSLSRPEGFRLVYPSKQLPNGKEINIFYPINKSTGNLISRAIIEKFQEIISKTIK